MEAVLEAARHALEGFEVLVAFATTATLGLGLLAAHRAEHAHRDDASSVETKR